MANSLDPGGARGNRNEEERALGLKPAIGGMAERLTKAAKHFHDQQHNSSPGS
jgi:hypothetical protein